MIDNDSCGFSYDAPRKKSEFLTYYPSDIGTPCEWRIYKKVIHTRCKHIITIDIEQYNPVFCPYCSSGIRRV